MIVKGDDAGNRETCMRNCSVHIFIENTGKTCYHLIFATGGRRSNHGLTDQRPVSATNNEQHCLRFWWSSAFVELQDLFLGYIIPYHITARSTLWMVIGALHRLMRLELGICGNQSSICTLNNSYYFITILAMYVRELSWIRWKRLPKKRYNLVI